jgi:hypothetical protein
MVLHKTTTTLVPEKDAKKGHQKNYGEFSVHLTDLNLGILVCYGLRQVSENVLRVKLTRVLSKWFR